MKNLFKILFVSMMLCMIPFSSEAAAKAITGMTVKCQNKLQAGTILSQAVIDTTGEDAGDVNITVTNTNCYIEDCSLSGNGSRFIAAGDKIKVKLAICVSDPENYRFSGSYSSSNIKISGGTFEKASVSADKETVNLTFTMTPVTGKLEAPEEAVWAAGERNLGLGKWESEKGSGGHYDLWLYRGSSVIKKFEAVKGLSYDFYPYMTKAGTYYFKVRAVPADSAEKKYSEHSDWTESDEYYLDSSRVSDGSGQEGLDNKAQVGWVLSGSTWYYRFPDGTLKKNGWEKISDRWYLFDADGMMLTGLQTVASGTYCMAESGEMLTGWVCIDGQWYFFNNTPGAETEGAMYKNIWLNDNAGRTYYMKPDGSMSVGWCSIDGGMYYFSASGELQRNTVIDTFYVDENGRWVIH